MIELNLESNIDQLYFNEPKLQPDILEAIAEIIRHDIEDNYDLGRSFDGSTIAPKKSGGRIFYETGQLLKSVYKSFRGGYWEIFIGSGRSDIASILQSGTPYMRARLAFGYSKRSDTETNKLLQTKTLKQLFGESIWKN